VSLVDVAPTLLREVGAPVPADMQGKPLQDLMLPAGAAEGWGDRKIYSESEYGEFAFSWSPLYAWRTGKYLFVAAPDRELYDQGLDPKTEHNLASANPAVADTLLSQLAAFQKRTGSAVEVDPNVNHTASQTLAALGYVSSAGVLSKGIEDVKGVDPKTRVEAANLQHKGLQDSLGADLEIAIEELQKSLQLEPNAKGAYLALGRSYRRLKDYDHAIPALRKAVELLPNLDAAQYELGRTLAEAGKWDEALPAFRAAVADNPKEREWHYDLAFAYEKTKQFPEAIEEFKKTVHLDPDHFRANLRLGRLLGMNGKSAEALPFLEKAAKLQPDSVEVHMYLANVYAALKQTARSEREQSLVERLKEAQPN